MVRLKENGQPRQGIVIDKFQFQYGSIKRRIECGVYERSEFQFQYGSIKSRNSPLGVTKYCCFNSNMVRLKARNAMKDLKNLSSFNSNMVRLKDLLLAQRIDV